MQITFDPLELSQKQREQLTGFILTFGCTTEEILQRHFDFTKGTGTGELRLMEDAKDIKNYGPITDEMVGAAIAKSQETFPIDPAAAFGSATPPPPPPPEISKAGPVLVVPPPPTFNSATAVVELDTAGVPWDERIHSNPPTKKADGTWRAKRGVDKNAAAEIAEELKHLSASLNVNPLTATTPPPPPPPPPVAGSAPPPPPAPDNRGEFVALVGRTSIAKGNKKITGEEVDAICAKFGLPNFAQLGAHLDLLAGVANDIDTLIASRG